MKYAIKMNDGSVSIMTLIDPSATIEGEILKWASDVQARVVSYRVILDSEIPNDRIFRNAWTDNNPTDTVDIDLEKAKDIIRDKRNKSLEILDEKAASEVRKPDGDLTAIDAEAQRLRDIPQDMRFNSNLVEVLKELYVEAEVNI